MFPRKFKLCYIILTLFINSIYCQNTTIKEDVSNKNALIEKLNATYNNVKNAPEKSYKIAKESLIIAEQENNLEAKIIANNIFSSYYNYQGDKTKAHYYSGLVYNMLDKKLKFSEFGYALAMNCAIYFRQAKDYDHAIKFYNEALLIYNSYTEKATHNRFLLISDLAYQYALKKKEILALDYYNLALEEAKCLNNTIWLSSAYNNLGYYYYAQLNYEKALSYYNKAKSYINIDTLGKWSELYYLNILENIAHIYLEYSKLYDEAAAIQKKVAKIRRKYNDETGAIFADIERLKSLTITKKFDEANKLKKNIDTYFKSKDSNEIIQDQDVAFAYERYLKAKLFNYEYTKEYNEYFKVSKTLSSFLKKQFDYNKIKNEEAIASYIKLQENDFKSKLKLEKELTLEKDASYKKDSFFLFLIIFMLCLTITSLVIINYAIKQRKKRTEQDNLITKLTLRNTTLEKEKLNDILESKEKDIINVVADNEMRTKFLIKLLNKIEGENKLSGNTDKIVKELAFDIKSQIQIEERLTTLQSDLTNANANFDTLLVEKYQHLTKTEREICSFIRLNFSTKEIAQVRNVSIGAIKMSRSRIRKKINLPSEMELDQFIQTL